jgi:hypothetical protein
MKKYLFGSKEKDNLMSALNLKTDDEVVSDYFG